MFNFKLFVVSPESSIKKKLAAVLDYLGSLIKEIIREEKESGSLFEGKIRKEEFWPQVVDKEVLIRMREAWPDVEVRLNKAQSYVGEMSEEAVYSHGLTGPELDLKLAALGWASKELISATGNISESIGPRKTKRIISILKKNFELVKILIESILEASGAGTALKEIVGIFTHSLKDFNKR
jgi:hypothetical protein